MRCEPRLFIIESSEYKAELWNHRAILKYVLTMTQLFKYKQYPQPQGLGCFFAPAPQYPGGSIPYSGLHGEVPPERGAFFRLGVYKRVGISQVGV